MDAAFSKTCPPAGTECEVLRLSDPCLTELPAVRVSGELHLRGMKRLTSIPSSAVQGHTLCLRGCPRLTELPEITRPLQRLELDGCGIRELPAGLQFTSNAVLVLQNCHRLTRLPEVVSGKKLGRIVVGNCPALTELPELRALRSILVRRLPFTMMDKLMAAPSVGISYWRKLQRITARIEAEAVSISGCPLLTECIAPRFALRLLHVSGCASLASLPQGLEFSGAPAWLRLRECAALKSWPAELNAAWLPEGTSRPALAVSLEGCPLQGIPEYSFPWSVSVRGVLMEPEAVLNPQGIEPSMVLNHWNAEVRRVLLENMGMETLLARTSHRVLDEDKDAGGPRRLIQFSLPPPPRRVPPGQVAPGFVQKAGAEFGKFLLRLLGRAVLNSPPPNAPGSRSSSGLVALRCRHLECRCPSTGRVYLLPVPPGQSTCRSAAAWLAGFDNPEEYAPIQET